MCINMIDARSVQFNSIVCPDLTCENNDDVTFEMRQISRLIHSSAKLLFHQTEPSGSKSKQ